MRKFLVTIIKWSFIAFVFFCIYQVFYGIKTAEQPYPDGVTDEGSYMLVQAKPVVPGTRVYYMGHVWLITKVSLQYPQNRIRQDEAYYSTNYTTRNEKDGLIVIETPANYKESDMLSGYAIFGIPLNM